jgi:hypothetical protein
MQTFWWKRRLRRDLMKNRSPFFIVLVFLVSLSIVVPVDLTAQVGQKAGQVSRAIPDVAIARGTQLARADQDPGRLGRCG